MFCLTSQHRIYAWGLNTNGRLGLASSSHKHQIRPELVKFPVPIKSLDNKKIQGLSAGNDHTFAWSTETSSVYGWGSGLKGKLGNDSDAIQPQPVQLQCLIQAAKYGYKVINITCGDSHTLATFKCMNNSLRDTHKLFVWGKNDMWQLGIDNQVAPEVRNPTEMDDPDPFKEKLMSVRAGPSSYSAALTTEGQVYTWGNGMFGRLGYVAKCQQQPKLVNEMSGTAIVRISLGMYHVAVVSKDGEVFTWGRGSNFQLGNGHAIAEDSPSKVQSLQGYFIIDVSCGETHTAALSDKGEVFTWGSGTLGQLGHGDLLRQSLPLRVSSFDEKFIKAISCGKSHSSAITAQGHLYTWGSNQFSQLGRFTQQNFLFIRSTSSTSGSGFSSAKTSPSMVYSNGNNNNNSNNMGGTLINAPLSKGSTSSGGEVVIGMTAPQKFEFPTLKNTTSPHIGPTVASIPTQQQHQQAYQHNVDLELNKIVAESIGWSQSPHMSSSSAGAGMSGGGGLVKRQHQIQVTSPSSLRKPPNSTKHQTQLHGARKIKQLEISSASGTPTEPQIPRRLQHVYDETPKYIKNLRSDLNLALKKNMELRRKIEEDYGIDRVISVGDKYRTLIQQSSKKSEAMKLIEEARIELDQMQGHADLRAFTERMLESLFKAK